MKFKFLKSVFTTLTIVITSTVHAGVINIMESDIYGDGTNRGFTLNTVGYHLDWLDFGLTSGISYNDIVSDVDKKYTGYRFATESEILELYDIIASDFVTTRTDNPLGFGENTFIIETDITTISQPNVTTTFWSTSDIVGLTGTQEAPFFERRYMKGLFLTDT